MQIYSKKDILEVAKILKSGGIIAFPTETVFGLGVLSNSKENFLKLVKLKNRNPDKPFTLMISKIEQVKDLVEIDAKTEKIIKKFMPLVLLASISIRKLENKYEEVFKNVYMASSIFLNDCLHLLFSSRSG